MVVVCRLLVADQPKPFIAIGDAACLPDGNLGSAFRWLAVWAFNPHWKSVQERLDCPVSGVRTAGVPPPTYRATFQQYFPEFVPWVRVCVGHEALDSTGCFVCENTNAGMQQAPVTPDVVLVNRRVAFRGDVYLTRAGPFITE